MQEVWSKSEKWYKHEVGSAIENYTVKILWGACIQVDRQIEYRKPDIVVMEMTVSKCLIKISNIY